MKTAFYSAFRSISVLNESNTLFSILSILTYVLFSFSLGQQEDTMRCNFFFIFFSMYFLLQQFYLMSFLKKPLLSYYTHTHFKLCQIQQDKYCFISVCTCLLNIELTMLAHYNDRSNLLKSCCVQNWLEGCQQSQHKLGTNAGLLNHSHIRQLTCKRLSADCFTKGCSKQCHFITQGPPQ